MDAVDVIRDKRDGKELTDEQIRWFVAAFTSGGVADEQAAALLMAIVWRGMTRRELATWTAEMIDSGDRLDLSTETRPTVDKHSTGGVGDKVSLVLAPIVAACGAAVPMLSGRGLGHTGGTLDKLEAIEGFRVALSADEMTSVLASVGCVICAAGETLAPADRKMYALRDVTATVESIPLIASSIISKKSAEGTRSLVLDVKVGSGAFMKEVEDARLLAETMVRLGRDRGVRATALLTDMDTVLGRAAGNALEVKEALDALNGRGPADLVELTLALANEMLALAGIDADPAGVIADGSALERFERMIAAQGGGLSRGLPAAAEQHVYASPATGFVTRLDARAVGVAAWRLGAGRARKEDPVSHGAGVVCLKKRGDRVTEGEPLLELHCDERSRLQPAREALRDVVEIGPHPPAPSPLVIDRIA